MTGKRYIYVDIGIGYEILDSWFGYTGDDEPTEREIEEYDYLVIGLESNQDAAEGICRRLNDQQDEINHLSNFGLHVILDKKNKEIEQLKQENERLKELLRKAEHELTSITGLISTDSRTLVKEDMENYDLFKLDYSELVNEIKKELKE